MSNTTMNETSMPPFEWQQDAWTSLYENARAGRVPHALLIKGMDGVGIELFSYALAKYLLCHAPLEDVACGRCQGCRLFSSQTHPDLFVLKREEATQIKVDQVRSCVTFVNKTSHFEPGKVVLVEEAELMNANAANALLKSLEEPYGKTTFILVTTKPSNLLATIHSRCQTISIHAPSSEQARDWLEKNKVNDASLLLQLAGGAPLKAKQWAEGNFVLDIESVCADISKILAGQLGVVQAAQRWQKLDFRRLLELQTQILSIAIRQIYAQGYTEKDAEKDAEKNAEALLPEGCRALLTQLPELELGLLFRLRDNFLDKVAQSQSFSNLNEGLAVEEMAMDWSAMSQIMARQRRAALSSVNV